MRVKFSIDSNNNINILDEDQNDTFIRIVQDGDLKVVTVSSPDSQWEEPISELLDEEGE